MRKIVFFDSKDYEVDFFNKLKFGEYDVVQVSGDFHSSVDENFENIKDAEIISVFTNSRINQEQLERFKNLKLIATRSTGFSHVDIDFCNRAGIEVVNVPRYGDCTVAEYAFALLLSVARKIKLSSEDLKSNKIIPEKYIGIDMYGKTIGVIGTGAIGGHFCKIANGFGMKILAYDPYPKKELENELNLEYVSLENLLKNSDIISLHAPSTASNIHMIDREQFDLMKEGVVIVNTARGELINTEVLYQELLNGKVAAAGLDVVECEELLSGNSKFLQKIDCKKQSCLEKTFINHKLLSMDNVVITPHMAYDTKEAIERILITTKDNIKSFIGGKVKNSVL